MKFEVLYNFISPVTGRILADSNYILVGNSRGMASPSPILIDIRLDISNLRKQSVLANAANFVIGTPNAQLPNAQVLSTMDNGFLYNTVGTVSSYSAIPLANLTDLSQGQIFIGDSNNRPVVGLPPRGPRGFPGPEGASGDDDIGTEGLAGLAGLAGRLGAAGEIGTSGKTGQDGAAGNNGVSTLAITTNYNMSGHNIINISPSPGGDFDAITAKWVWDLVSDNISTDF